MGKDVSERLYELKDEKYGDFQAKLVPNIPRESVLGIRVPDIRKLAKELVRNGGYESFIDDLPHKYYDENMLHAAILSEIKDYDIALSATEKFLPYIDNWAVCDTLIPKVFKKHPDIFVKDVLRWCKSDLTYTCRYGVGMLMRNFLDEEFKTEYLDVPCQIHSDEYYVKMMVAWYFATALAKKWDDVIPYIEDKRLEVWTHNKAIQKAIESYRITDDQKKYLRTLKIKER